MNHGLQPFHYVGNKSKQIEQILSLVPEGQPERVIDVFGGSGMVGLTIASAFETKLVYNELADPVRKLFSDLVKDYFGRIDTADLSEFLSITSLEFSDDAGGFAKLKSAYNGIIKLPEELRPKYTESVLLLLLTCRAFNNGIRFSKRKGEFNYTYGQRNYLDVEHISNVLDTVNDTISEIKVTGNDFAFALDETEKGDFVFIDPPYIGTDATYNQIWSEQNDKVMYQKLSEMSERGVKWMLTNVIENRGKLNENLDKFIKNNPSLKVVETGRDYSNAARQRHKNKSVEYIITNY